LQHQAVTKANLGSDTGTVQPELIKSPQQVEIITSGEQGPLANNYACFKMVF